MNKNITIVENPVVQSYEQIEKDYFNKWVAIYQPNRELVFEEGTVIAYGDAKLDLLWELYDYLESVYGEGKGSVKRFREEDWSEGYVIFSNVQKELPE